MGRELRIQLGENKGERQTEDKLSKSTRFTCSDFGKIDKNYDFFTFCETVHRNQKAEEKNQRSQRAPRKKKSKREREKEKNKERKNKRKTERKKEGHEMETTRTTSTETDKGQGASCAPEAPR
jgi:FKBP-type peptidyl-prolyl cis-trans isomerase